MDLADEPWIPAHLERFFGNSLGVKCCQRNLRGGEYKVNAQREEQMERAIAVLVLTVALGGVSAKAQDGETFEDAGGTCSTHTVSHNGGAAVNWVCMAPIHSGAIEASSMSFSVVLNSDGSFNNGYISFFDQTGQLAFVSTNFSGNYDGAKFSGVFSGTMPDGAFFSGQTDQALASRVFIVRGVKRTYYSIGAGSGDLTIS